MITLYIVSLSIFVIYMIDILIKFGVPESISESAYLYGRNGKISIKFYIALIAVMIPLLVFWLHITTGQEYQFTVFLSCAALGFVAATGNFRDKGDIAGIIHVVSVFIGVVCSQIWALLSVKYYWIPAIFCALIASTIGIKIKGAQRTKSGTLVRKANSVIFFNEVAIFLLVYASILVYYLLGN